ncbi:MAG: D-3-phosphoglycerate dehydrogenase [Ruminococcus sp.]|nr:D-3-phosphoglycerate dehydrogenase [Ruminococcus sp.]
MLKILCTAEFDKTYLDILSEFAEVRQRGFSVNQDFREMLTKEELINELGDADIFIVGYDKVTDEIIRSAPDLKLILSVRDGPEENIDVKTCKELGIPVLFSAGRCARVVPEHTMLLILASARPLIWANNALYSGLWSKETQIKEPERYFNFFKRIDESHEIYGKTLGIVGAGRNGVGLAQRAQAFGMKIIAFDPYADKNRMDSLGIELVDLMTLMSASDYVSMMARVTPETTGMIGKKEFSAMKQDACFVNTGRAALVDNAALLEALQNGRIRAALDVYDAEPISRNSPLLKLDPSRVLLSPHFAGCSVERINFHSKAATDNILHFLKGIENSHMYDKEVIHTEEYTKRGGVLWNSMK